MRQSAHAVQSLVFPIDARAVVVRKISTTGRKISRRAVLQPSPQASLAGPRAVPQPEKFA